MIHDVGRMDRDRLEPIPNVDDKQVNRMAHGTTGFTLVFDDSTNQPTLTVKDGKIQIRRKDGTLMYQAGVRESDGEGAVDTAKPTGTLT